MENLYIISPNEHLSDMLQKMIKAFASNFNSVTYIKSTRDYSNLKNKKVLFAIELGSIGYDIPMLSFFEKVAQGDDKLFYGSTAALLVHSNNEFGTKRAAQDVIFLSNNLGCTFIGKPLVEATSSLKNFLTWQKVIPLPLEDICISLSNKLGKRLLEYKNSPSKENRKITVLYSSPNKFSNTLELWNMIKKHLINLNIKEIQIKNDKIQDCRGCTYKLCVHYSSQKSCFYGGVVVEDILPAIEESDSIVWLCPNYNDAIAANLTAMINRLTVLYNRITFYDKSIFGVIVSGNSGSDSVAKQLIGALNINKGFKLLPYAIMTETANDPKAIFEIKDIETKAETFAKYVTGCSRSLT